MNSFDQSIHVGSGEIGVLHALQVNASDQPRGLLSMPRASGIVPFTKDRGIVSRVVPAHTSNYDVNGRYNRSIIGVVIHTMVGFLEGTASYFQQERPAFPSAAHYGVALDGRVWQFVPESKPAYHAGRTLNPTAKLVRLRPNENPNWYTIGIETEDHGNPELARPRAQIEAVAQLTAKITAGYDIPPTRDQIIQHHEVYSGKSCPGSFPMTALVNRVQQIRRL